MEAYEADHEADALKLMEACAAQGDPVACYLAALWYRNGEGTYPDEAKSSYWRQQLVLLAESGDAEAQWELGQYLRFGDVFPMDIQVANRWLEESAERGFGAAQHHLAWYLETGQYDTSKIATRPRRGIGAHLSKTTQKPSTSLHCASLKEGKSRKLRLPCFGELPTRDSDRHSMSCENICIESDVEIPQ